MSFEEHSVLHKWTDQPSIASLHNTADSVEKEDNATNVNESKHVDNQFAHKCEELNEQVSSWKSYEQTYDMAI